MFKLSNDGLTKVKAELARYEAKESAIIPSLYIAQKENGGWVSDAVIEHLASVMAIPSARITEVFKFYTMFNQKPVGRYHVQVCTNISCAINGARELTHHLIKEFHTKLDEVTQDGKFCFSKVECLGSCGTAPMMQVNDDYHENLTKESAVKLLRSLP
ncbi:MAG: NAD(P)H-dependent oxidoreductase subunit E [Pseudobdellovibrionaceae bacterium]